MPMDVVVQTDEEGQERLVEGEDTESRFFTCHVCGDNWLSLKEQPAEGDCQIVFIHQMGMDPVLKRVAYMETHVVLNEDTVDHWDYFLNDDPVDADVWHAKLKDRRKLLKSICSN
jgi:predicted SnoaL-like aldol condensation-catalyzing enzyme